MIESCILGVIVLYKQNLSVSLTIDSINKSLKKYGEYLCLFVYDNSPIRQYDEDEFSYKNFLVYYKHDPNNSGISTAYNQGANLAAKFNKNWILLLDQDTTFQQDFFEKMELDINKYPDIGLFAPILKLTDNSIFSPCKYRFHRGFPIGSIKPGQYSLNNISPVNSGMLIKVDNFLKVGGYNEKIPLDFSDFQFIERYKLHFNTFCIVDSMGIQFFSNNESNIDKLVQRFFYYCKGAYFCEKPRFIDKIIYFFIVLFRALSLTWRTKRQMFMSMFFSIYLKKNK